MGNWFGRNNQEKIFLKYLPIGRAYKQAFIEGSNFNKIIKWISFSFQWLVDRYNQTFKSLYICEGDFYSITEKEEIVKLKTPEPIGEPQEIDSNDISSFFKKFELLPSVKKEKKFKLDRVEIIGEPKKICSKRTYSVLKNDDDLYISCRDGVFVMTKKGNEWSQPKKIFSKRAYSVFKEGNDLYISCRDGVFVMTKKGNEWSQPKKIFSKRANSVLKNDDDLYISGHDDVFVMTKKGNEWSQPKKIFSKRAYSVFKEGDDLYISCRDGVFVITKKGNEWSQPKKICSDYYASSVFKEGDDLYISGHNGVFVMTKKGNEWSQPKKICSERANSVLKNDEDLYISGHNGVFVITKKGNEWSQPKKIFSDYASSVFKEGDDLYISGHDGVFVIKLKTHETIEFNAYEDDDIYIKGNDDGVFLYKKQGSQLSQPKKLNLNRDFSVLKNDEDLYISGPDGVFVITKKGNEWSQPKKICSEQANSVFKEGRNIYIAAMDSGVSLITQEEGQWSQPKKIYSDYAKSVYKKDLDLYILGEFEKTHVLKLKTYETRSKNIYKSNYLFAKWKTDYNIPNSIFYFNEKENKTDLFVLRYLMRGNTEWHFKAIANIYGVDVIIKRGKEFFKTFKPIEEEAGKKQDDKGLAEINKIYKRYESNKADGNIFFLNDIIVISFVGVKYDILPHSIPHKLGSGVKLEKIKKIYNIIREAQCRILYFSVSIEEGEKYVENNRIKFSGGINL